MKQTTRAAQFFFTSGPKFPHFTQFTLTSKKKLFLRLIWVGASRECPYYASPTSAESEVLDAPAGLFGTP
ncbi:MAG TPA: hypothetical protein VHY37_08935, partial [Tepidisphaeraceae bacterium]|nr:hypothetical protein [Tepidisphaeraceae bacterium]